MRIVASAMLAALFLLGIVTSGPWPAGPRNFLLVVAIPGLALSLVEVVVGIRRQRRRPAQGRAPGFAAIPPVEPPKAPAAVHRREALFIVWLVAYAVSTWALGTIISSMLFLFFYLRFAARESWLTTSVVTGVTTLFLWKLMGDVLGMATLNGIVGY